jgi:hypothetical protein
MKTGLVSNRSLLTLLGLIRHDIIQSNRSLLTLLGLIRHDIIQAQRYAHENWPRVPKEYRVERDLVVSKETYYRCKKDPVLRQTRPNIEAEEF